MYTVQFFFLSLVAYCHDMVMVSGLRDRGVVHGRGPVAHSMDEAVSLVCRELSEDTSHGEECILQEEEDGEMRWMNGISVQEMDRLNMRLAQYRQVADVLNHGIGRLKGNPEVDAWLKANGGLTRINEVLCGRNLTSPRGWYNSTRRYLKRHLGYDPSPLGERAFEHADTATKYSGYAVNVHRTLANQKAYGLIPDLEGENDWATTEVDLQIIPGWYRKLATSQKLIGHKAGSKNLSVAAQIAMGLKPDGMVPRLRPVLCVGPNLGGSPYTLLYNEYSDAVIDRNLTVQELLWRFKNAPDRLRWKKIKLGNLPKYSWVAGIRTPKGQSMWLSLSEKSNEKFDYHTNDGANVEGMKINFLLPPREKAETYDKYNLVKGHRSIRTRKEGENIVAVHEATKGYVCYCPDCNGREYVQIVHVSEETFTPKMEIRNGEPTLVTAGAQWGKKKKALLKQGWKPSQVRTGTFKPKAEDHKDMDI